MVVFTSGHLCILQPGDCIAFNMKMLHGAPPNTTDVPRRVISTRWLGTLSYIIKIL